MPQLYKLHSAFSAENRNYAIDYENELNSEQLPIVKAGRGPILVIAGAGSGKTRTVTYRVAYLVESGVPLQNILLVTFTNKASREMIYRVEGLLKRSLQGLWAGTFHHIGNLILRKHAKKIGFLKNFTIMDRGDSTDLITRTIKEAGINLKDKKFPKAEVLQDIYSYAVNSQKELFRVIEEKHSHLFELQGEIKRVLDLYEGTKQNQNLMDFDDLLSKWHALLLENPEVLQELSGRFQYILADEYQDTNLVQAQIIDLLASKHRNLMVVGDDSQCVIKGTKILTPNGYKKVETLKRGDAVISGGGNGRLVDSKILQLRKSSHSEYLSVSTSNGKKISVSPNHLCFAKLKTLSDYWYVYLMYRRDLGYRIGVTNLPKFQKGNPRIQMRTSFEQAEKMWLLGAFKNRQEAQYRETVLGLRYQIPQTLFVPESRARKNSNVRTMSNNQSAEIFKEFGENGIKLLKDFGHLYDYPTFIPKSSKSLNRININLLMASASNREENRMKQRHELCVESNYGWEAVKKYKETKSCNGYWRLRKYCSDYKILLEFAEQLKLDLQNFGQEAVIVYKGKFLSAKKISGSFRIIPAAGLLPGMLVPIVNNGRVMLDEIAFVDRVSNKPDAPFYDLEVEKSHNIICNGIITHNSIYSFRAAEFKNIIEFPSRYPDCQIFKIETNHRSTPEILAFANESIKNAEEKFEKKLKAVRKQGINPVVVSFRDVHQQAGFVAQRILELYNESTPLNEIAVIYRSHYHCLELQMELTRRGIPHEVRSGLRLFEEAHIKDVMSYLKIFHNPHDGLSWFRILKLASGVGQKTAEKIWQRIQKTKDPIVEILKQEIVSEILKGGEEAFSNLQVLLKVLDKQKDSPSDMMETIIEHGYAEYLRLNYPNYQAREEELQELANYASEYDSLEKFLSAMALVGGNKAEEIVPGGRGEKEAVVLTTVHQAKGLEWKAVFVIWLSEGRFPSYLSFNKKEELEEERRLFYVAVTRSKDQLYLLYPISYQSREGNIILKASRFIKEISERRYDKWLIEDELGIDEDGEIKERDEEEVEIWD